MSNVGKIIKKSYLNGFAGRNYDSDGSVIIADGGDWLVIVDTNGQKSFIDLQDYPSENRQDLINEWCNE